MMGDGKSEPSEPTLTAPSKPAASSSGQGPSAATAAAAPVERGAEPGAEPGTESSAASPADMTAERSEPSPAKVAEPTGGWLAALPGRLRAFGFEPFHSRLGLLAITILLVVKIAISLSNNTTYDVKLGYDEGHHAWRARSAGLEMGNMAYNPPLYYLPALPDAKLDRFYKNGKPLLNVRFNKRKAPEAYAMMERLQGLNVLYLIVFYASWIYGVFPRVLKDGRLWLLASTLLLAMPGYQRLAANVHPDNLLSALTGVGAVMAVSFAEKRVISFPANVCFAAFTGLIGLTRPFAIVPIAAFWALNVRSIVHAGRAAAARPRWQRFAAMTAKVATVTVIVGALAGSWWGYRYAMTGRLVNVYRDAYMENYLPLQKNFDRVHYYSSFYLEELLAKPNRTMAKGLERSHEPLGNSFHTLVYSELWNDHWLVFSGKAKNVESKAKYKRVMLMYALPITATLLAMFVVGQVRIWRDALRRRTLSSPALWMAAVALMGWAIFVWWQGGAGLTPGKNSGVKFIYVAYLWPFMIVTCLSAFRAGRWAWVMLAAFAGLFVLALPLALYKI